MQLEAAASDRLAIDLQHRLKAAGDSTQLINLYAVIQIGMVVVDDSQILNQVS